MKKKEASKGKQGQTAPVGAAFTEVEYGKIATKVDLKGFLMGIRDKMTDGSAAPIYVMTAMNHLLNSPDIFALIDNENKEIARDIWLRLKQSGMQIRAPGMLFGPDEVVGATNNV